PENIPPPALTQVSCRGRYFACLVFGSVALVPPVTVGCLVIFEADGAEPVTIFEHHAAHRPDLASWIGVTNAVPAAAAVMARRLVCRYRSVVASDAWPRNSCT